MRQTDIIVIGAGAAGLMCAMEAGKRGRKVLVLERAASIGKKIHISGGGRCNFTNVNAAPENYLSENPNFCKSALVRYTPQDFINLVERHDIHYHEKKLGQLFCDGSSREIVQMLEEECRRARVEIRTNVNVRGVSKLELNDEQRARFQVEIDCETLTCESLVIATGGVSIPKMGAPDVGHRAARGFGLRVTQLKPALVPLTWAAGEAEQLRELSGISLEASVGYKQIEFDENILLTHRGLSGPAVLQISSYWSAPDAIRVRLLPHIDVEKMLHAHRHEASELATVLSNYLPKRFAQAWCALYAKSKPMHRYSESELARIAASLTAWQLAPHGTEGYAKAEVTLGGVDTRELSSKTMEAKRLENLYFIGEVVDVTGHLGGYNFQWAWASGFAAGQHV